MKNRVWNHPNIKYISILQSTLKREQGRRTCFSDIPPSGKVEKVKPRSVQIDFVCWLDGGLGKFKLATKLKTAFILSSGNASPAAGWPSSQSGVRGWSQYISIYQYISKRGERMITIYQLDLRRLQKYKEHMCVSGLQIIKTECN